MSINKNNYETYLIDYLDGKLSPSEVAEVLLFLEQFPEIAAEFEGIATTQILPIDTLFFEASSLKKPSFNQIKQEYETLLIDNIEGNLTAVDTDKLEKALKLYPELKHEQLLFEQTHLQPDATVVFKNKQVLKKGDLFIKYNSKWLRVAASLLILGGIGLWLNSIVRTNKSALQATKIDVTNNVKPKEKLPINKNSTLVVVPHKINKQQGKSNDNNRSIATATRIETKTIEPSLFSMNHIQIAQPTLFKVNHTIVNQSTKYNAVQYESSNDGYTDVLSLIKKRIQKNASLAEKKALLTLTEANKIAGITINKDSSGKIKHIEIASLGVAWSQSK
jgi:hypothetical protein